MASRKTYTCFVCQKAGHDVQVFLDGKDSEGHTKYLNEDGTRHTHLGSSLSLQSEQQQSKQQQKTQVNNNPVPLLRMMDAKLEKIIALLEEEQSK